MRLHRRRPARPGQDPGRGGRGPLDFDQPVALLLFGVLHHIPDTEQARDIVRRPVPALPPGSYLAVNHSTSAVSGAAMEDAVAHWNRVGTRR